MRKRMQIIFQDPYSSLDARMTISDIIEIIVVCALIFFPLGYLARHSLRRIRDTLRLFFAKPRYVKPAGTLRRTEKARATKK